MERIVLVSMEEVAVDLMEEIEQVLMEAILEGLEEVVVGLIVIEEDFKEVDVQGLGGVEVEAI